MTMLNTMPSGAISGTDDDGWVAWDSLPKTEFRNARYRVFYNKAEWVYIQIEMYHTLNKTFSINYPDGYRSRGSTTNLYLLPDVGPDKYSDPPIRVDDEYTLNRLSVMGSTNSNTYVGPIVGFVHADIA